MAGLGACRAWAACCVAFLTHSRAVDCKKTPCSPSQSVCLSSETVMQRIPKAALDKLVLLPMKKVTRALAKPKQAKPSRNRRCEPEGTGFRPKLHEFVHIDSISKRDLTFAIQK